MKFIADAPLGRLVKWLRILGFDTLYYRADPLDKLIERAEREGRIILTRNRRLRERLEGRDFLFITNDKPLLQLREVIQRYDIYPGRGGSLFSRCLRCNRLLEEVEKADVVGKVPEYVYQTHDRFLTCGKCQRIYWAGTHLERMEQELKKIL